MRLTTTLAAAAAIAVSGVAANAGGLTAPVEAPIVEVMTPAPAGSFSSGILASCGNCLHSCTLDFFSS